MEAIPCLESVNVANRQRSEGWRVIILETETRPNPWALLSPAGGPACTLTACVPSACDVIDLLGVWLTQIRPAESKTALAHSQERA